MAIYLTDDQAKLVATKRRATRPQYYNAEFKQSLTITEDFEAFLVLLGRARTREALDWLQKAIGLGANDSDRDALVSQALTNDGKDASNKFIELRPFVRQFEYFRQNFSIAGFESVTETGLLLEDMQRAMAELKISGDRWTHQQLWDQANLDLLSNRGLTIDQKHQLDSWANTLTAY